MRRLALAAAALVIGARIAAPFDATQIVLPGYVGTVAGTMATVVDQIRCVVVIMPFSLTGATKLTFGVLTTAGTCSVGLYPDSNGGSILLSSSVSCASSGAKVGTSSSANVVAGTPYRLCMCSSSTSTTTNVVDDTSASGSKLGDLLNVTTTRMGTAASTCTTGALPPTTGALTPAVFQGPPLVVIE